MEYIDGETLTTKNLNEKMVKGVRLQLQRAIELLHDAQKRANLRRMEHLSIK